MDSEIMEVLLHEAQESYSGDIVIELRSNDADDIEANSERIEIWIKDWKQDQNEAAVQAPNCTMAGVLDVTSEPGAIA